MTGKEYKFMPSVSCHTKNIIYLVTCDKCKKQYVGKTAQTLKQRHYGHRREIDKQSSNLGKHFSEDCGYTNFRIQVSFFPPCENDKIVSQQSLYLFRLLITPVVVKLYNVVKAIGSTN